MFIPFCAACVSDSYTYLLLKTLGGWIQIWFAVWLKSAGINVPYGIV